MTEPTKLRALSVLEQLEREAEARGFRRGLAVAERIQGWLTMDYPPKEGWAELRRWADAAINKARREL